MIRLLLLLALAKAHDLIPPVEVNIRSLGAMLGSGKNVPPVDLWLAYSLRPLDELCEGDYIGTIRQSLVDTDLPSHWVLQQFVEASGEVVYMLCLPRLLGCVQLFGEGATKGCSLAQTSHDDSRTRRLDGVFIPPAKISTT